MQHIVRCLYTLLLTNFDSRTKQQNRVIATLVFSPIIQHTERKMRNKCADGLENVSADSTENKLSF